MIVYLRVLVVIDMQKDEFPLLVEHTQLTYLDSAATSQCPQVVLDALASAYTTIKANAHRGQYLVSVRATEALENARKTFAEFIHAQPDEVVFTKNTTEALNGLARSLPLGPGDEVLVSEVEHHSNFVPWQQEAKRVDAKFSLIPYDVLRDDLQFSSDLITEKTKIFAVTAMSNVSGRVFAIKDFIAQVRKKNPDTIIVVDACQLAPHFPIDVQELDADFLTFSAHKMFGPFGVGVLYGKQGRLANLEPFLFGGSMVSRVSEHETLWLAPPARFEAGTLDVPSIVGAARAVTYVNDIGWDTINEHEKYLLDLALERLRLIEGMNIIGHDNEHGTYGPIISFTVDGIASDDIATICNHKGVAVRAGKHCAEPFLRAIGKSSAIRVSLALYNSPEDIDALMDALQEAVRIFRK